jgi:hypothetical protein
MAINYGWFANLSSIANLSSSISGSSIAGEGASIEVTAKAFQYGSSRVAGNGPSSYISFDHASANIDVVKSGSAVATEFNLGFSATEPNNIKVENFDDSGTPSYKFYKDDVLVRTKASSSGSNGFWTINALLSAASAGKEGSISNLIVRSDASTIIANWDGNFVLNAAGDAFITRTEANNNPSLAESGYDLKMYDTTSVSGNHVTLPAGTTWTFASDFSLPASVAAGATFNFTAPSDFTTEAVSLGGSPLPFTFGTPPDGTADAPAMGDVSGFPRFGTQQIQLRDDTAGLTAEQDADWQPSGTYEYITLTSDPSTTDPASICFGWTDPLVTGDQVVFDPAVINFVDSSAQDDPPEYTGRYTIATTSETFTSQYFIIDDNGMQESTITQDSTGVVIPTVTVDDPGLIPVNTATPITATTTDAATFLWEVLSQPAGSTVTFDPSTSEDTEVTVDTAGAYGFRLTATNAAGDGSANATITVNAGLQSTLNLTVTGIPDGAQAVKLNRRDTGAQVFTGNATFSGGSASITVNVAAGAELYGIWFGDNPPTTGAGLYGVTE